MQSRINALHNNSGVLTSRRMVTAHGYEAHYTVNTLALCVTLQSLRPTLKRAAGAPKIMIFNTFSAAQNTARSCHVDTLSDPKEISGLKGAYATRGLAPIALGTTRAHGPKRDLVVIGTLVRSHSGSGEIAVTGVVTSVISFRLIALG